MSKRKKREIGSYLTSAVQLAKIIPSLKKYKRRKKLSRWEKGAITRAEKKVRWAHNLVPVDARFAKLRPDLLFARGVQAVELSNTGNVKLKTSGKDLVIESNGRLWLYQSIPHITRQRIKNKADEILNNFDENFDVEAILKMAQKAFATGKVLAVHLWTERGRAGDAFQDFQQFVRWLNDRWQVYKEHQSWMRGLAILYGDASDLRDYKREVAGRRREERRNKGKRRAR